jgi:hypothetical protein
VLYSPGRQRMIERTPASVSVRTEGVVLIEMPLS